VTSWSALADELARWQEAGRTPELWWRDDDAADATPALDRLLALQRTHALPLALAVVPARATPALAARLSQAQDTDLLQHGYAHTNHAPAGEKKAELGPERPAMIVLGELGTGWLALERWANILPVLVPPWNRIAPGLVPALPEIGFRGLSTFGIRSRARPVSGLVQVNTHIDLIDWRTRRFAGAEAVLGACTQALAASRRGAETNKRTGQEARGSGEPIGLLSHHLAMDEAAWDFLNSFWGRMGQLPAIRIRPARELFASTESWA
jgi:hypothetical protein